MHMVAILGMWMWMGIVGLWVWVWEGSHTRMGIVVVKGAAMGARGSCQGMQRSNKGEQRMRPILDLVNWALQPADMAPTLPFLPCTILHRGVTMRMGMGKGMGKGMAVGMGMGMGSGRASLGQVKGVGILAESTPRIWAMLRVEGHLVAVHHTLLADPLPGTCSAQQE